MMTVSTTQILAQDIPIAPLSQQNISNPQLIQYPQNLHIYKDFQEEKKSELIEERKAQIPPTTIPQNSPAQMVSTIQNHRNLPCFKFGIQQCQNFDMIFQKWHTKNPLEEEKEGLNDSQIIGQLKESENDVSIDGPLQIQSLHQARFLKQDSKPNSNFSGATPSTQGSSGMGPLSDLTSQLMMPPPQLSQKEKEDVRQEQQRRKMMQAQIKKHPFEVKPMSRGFDRLNLETSAMYQSRDSTFKGQLPRINQASNFITQVEEVKIPPQQPVLATLQRMRQGGINLEDTQIPLSQSMQQPPLYFAMQQMSESGDDESSLDQTICMGKKGNSDTTSLESSVRSLLQLVQNTSLDQSRSSQQVSEQSLDNSHVSGASSIDDVFLMNLDREQFHRLQKGNIEMKETIDSIIEIVQENIGRLNFYSVTSAQLEGIRGLLMQEELLITQNVYTSLKPQAALIGLERLMQLKPTSSRIDCKLYLS
ncbi:hypothetical protein FGO68_gene11260 [Halteria grandinella]|uniref:Uncharacterized protein n=1 Tax=Halteria grandinella TaxID=5974 RepID=A0A8J8T3Y0_HALGN|nr:hypothetical protein FGO68_gene11260 [Halteria grandinella]